MTAPASGLLVVPGLPAQPSQTWATTEVDEPSTPVLREGLTPDDVTPGLLGFLVIFGAAVACIPLFRSLTSKLRGVDRRAPADDPEAGDGAAEAADEPTEGTDGGRGTQVDGLR
ncbi:hypothetical protein [Actinotalea sp. K2]|uniref:hypothetical protein n=1 Tax=Actinotalea sp. K2 TaxID=2939438 RepID=UPI0020173BEE|nr:hypothetical protein [Actinotalea sp. K2]MCL3862556.1 hypothetical protein [Actinotalea sp. K2]